MAAWGSAPRVRAVGSGRRRLNIHIQTMAIFTRHLAARAVAVVFAAWQALASSGAAWEARVVDAATGKPLPSASVKTAAGRKTITNSEGWFEVECAPAESVTVSFVGYRPVTVAASHAASRVALQPMAVSLEEVVVMPVDKVVKGVIAEARRQMKKQRRRKTTFFYRQISFADGECIEVLEAFFKAKPVVAVSDMALMYGRYAAVGADSTAAPSFFGNFFTYSQMELVGGERPLDTQDMMPLVDNYATYYDVGLRVITDGRRRLMVLRFRPRAGVGRPILDCELYVDMRSMHILRCVGKGVNMRVLNMFNKVNVVSEVDDMSFDINMADEGGYSEVESMAVSVSFACGGTRSHIRSLMFNVGKGKRLRQGRYMLFFDNLQRKIDRQGYDAGFWRDNEVVKRTPLEEKAVRMFERRNLFGQF